MVLWELAGEAGAKDDMSENMSSEVVSGAKAVAMGSRLGEAKLAMKSS